MGDRQHDIARDGVIGIVANILLASAKVAIGVTVGSIAVALDGLNNAVDSLSSVMMVVGARLASKGPDYEHPMGHGRIESMTALALSLLVTYAGAKATVEAVSSMGGDAVPSYDMATTLALVLGIAAKGALSRFLASEGRRLNSTVLSAASKDARNDMLLSAGTVASAVVAMASGRSIEPYVGFVIAVFVLLSGVGMMRDVTSDLVGMRVPSEKADEVLGQIMGFDEVSGVHDLVIHSYGPESLVASARIEVDPSMDVARFAFLEREIAEAVERETGVRVVALGACCSGNAGDSQARSAYAVAESHDEVLQAHGFVESEDGNVARIDIVVGYDEDSPSSVADAVADEIAGELGYDEVMVTVDRGATAD